MRQGEEKGKQRKEKGGKGKRRGGNRERKVNELVHREVISRYLIFFFSSFFWMVGDVMEGRR